MDARRALLFVGVWATAIAAAFLTDRHFEDIDVYRAGGRAWLDGLSLYGNEFGWTVTPRPLGYTYPPLSAALFAGLAVLPRWLAITTFSAVGLAGLAATVLVAAQRIRAHGVQFPAHDSPPGSGGPETRIRPHATAARIHPQPPEPSTGSPAPYPSPPSADRLEQGRPPKGWAGAALGAASGFLILVGLVLGTVSEPVRDTLTFGQVNLVLMGLVALDCLLPKTPWPRGMLIGAAAAIKLTPAFFVLFFLVRLQWRPAITAAVTAVALSGLGFLLAWNDSVTYWTSAVLNPDRIGTPDMAANQSLTGVIHRLGLSGATASAAWVLLGSAVVGTALLIARKLRSTGDDVGALLVVAAAGLLVSPISWSHHWVWVVPGFVYAVHRWRWAAVPALAFVVGPFWFLPRRDGRELAWTPIEQVIGNAYVWLAVAFLIAVGHRIWANASYRSPGSTMTRAATRSAPNPAPTAKTGPPCPHPTPRESQAG